MTKEREAWTKVLDQFKELSYMYDKKHKDYLNRYMRQNAYKMLLQVYNKEVGKDMTLTNFKKKLENMRTSYGRELKKVNASKQTGSGSGDVYVPSLWYYNLFGFLGEQTEPSRTGTDTFDLEENFELPESEETSSENKQVHDKQIPVINSKTPLSKKQKMAFKKKQEIILDSAQALMTQKEDEWEIIGKSIGLQMRGLSTHQQVIVQKIISDAIFYGKLGKLTNESQITLSPQHIAAPYPLARISQRRFSNFKPSSSI